ncbi:L-fuculose-phosphate aldolase [Planifilum fulgidum]|jgi:L-fuculose-phosphate aldolase|uniref:L-fuculose-phosphate aldolase n=1 Tax=Planifilum fulgidum TaxID=201973 RepID=A0A1I2P7U4_9BACL|nr:class II aldolase/adducin family protein [Planifilum fulgidum]MBO2496631.1 class II aldolase family protein [Bacillota bacterium]MBO2533838.1 class II aldolase family protein [Thermoactinomycetaceae bacterium]SFG11149.1 L-fuculose-phosphate aldolase [Planifilum fulgidum]
MGECVVEELKELIHTAKELYRTGLVRGTSGNVSVRDPESPGRMWITPSAIPYDEITVEDLVQVDLESGTPVRGSRKPSSETPMHRAIYRLRSDVRAVVHTHSTYATMFACAGEEIPAVHYLIAEIGDRVPVADYAVYGSEELARNAVEALRRAGANGALLKNHGVIAVGESLSKAYVRAEIIETVAQLAFGAKMIGRWELLTPEQLEETRKNFGSYFAAREDR